MKNPSSRGQFTRIGLLGAVLLGTIGCGPEFDPPSQLQSLRILAVKKDDPYLRPNGATLADAETDYQPDSTAHMTLAMQDARLDEDKQQTATEPIQKLWFGGCNNPFNDNYFGCLLNVWLSFKAFTELGPGSLTDGQTWSIGEHAEEIGYTRLLKFIEDTFPKQLEKWQDSDGQSSGVGGISEEDLLNMASALRVGAGDTFDYTVPPWVIEQHPRSTDRDVPRYGLSQVFLAVCDGEIGLSPAWEQVDDPLAILTDATRGFPLTCYERRTNKERGPDHFMVSYSNLFVYDEIKNKNPMIGGFSFDGERLGDSAVCIGESCVGREPSSTCDASMHRVKRCQRGGASDCKEYEIAPILAQEDAPEIDELASRVGGGNAQLLEQMWIRYYADQGEIKNDAKRLQDATQGRFAENQTKWTAPSQGEGEKPAHLWSVVYDNRGGVDWARVSVCVED